MIRSYSRRSSTRGPHIFLMIVGFIICWPLGLAMLAYMFWGDEINEMFKDFKTRVETEASRCRSARRHNHGFTRTGNIAFDDYRKSELERLEEEYRRLETEKEEFETFLQELHRAKDKEEFDRFMTSRHNRKTSSDSYSPDNTSAS